MSFIRLFKVEGLKHKRTRIYLIPIIILITGIIWFILALGKDSMLNYFDNIIGTILSLNNMIIPIMIGIFCIKSIEVETQGNGYKLLNFYDSNQSKIMNAKIIFVNVYFTFITLIEIVIIIIFAKYKGIEIELINLFLFLLNCTIFNFALICCLLLLNYLFNKKIVITIVISFFFGFLFYQPSGLLYVLPWSLNLYLTPSNSLTYMKQAEMITNNSQLYIRVMIAILISMIYYILTYLIINKKNMEGN